MPFKLITIFLCNVSSEFTCVLSKQSWREQTRIHLTLWQRRSISSHRSIVGDRNQWPDLGELARAMPFLKGAGDKMCLGSTYFECCLTLSLFPNIPPGPLKWELSAYIAKLRRATDEIYFIDDGWNFTQRVNLTNSTDF